MKSCPTCDTRIQVTPEHVEACAALTARRARIEEDARSASRHTPNAPVTGTQAHDVYAHLRSHPYSLSDDQAERAVTLLLDLGWRPCIRTPETQAAPALVGGVQDALDLGGVS